MRDVFRNVRFSAFRAAMKDMAVVIFLMFICMVCLRLPIYKQQETRISCFSRSCSKKGNATLTIRGTGEYGGSKSVKFKILPKWMKRTN